MNKKLKTLILGGTIAGAVALTGCASEPKPAGSCGAGKCGAGNCGNKAKSEKMQGSCGAGSCGGSMKSNTSEKERKMQGSCGAGSCGAMSN